MQAQIVSQKNSVKDGPTKTIIKECKDAHNAVRITTVREFVLRLTYMIH